ncbi:MAG: flagellar hook-length control protein FliK [Sulfurimonas sp.]|uniref:flagellar hook-length control protein FliK n=1 Tax=Sulfurimonas sp. TaxID=2022749 RepID=UPI0025D44607|nr:flagellar hook-length control protein FliK [Sulfurimonas sp.]MCK9491692.1 flagellar hook-length control protein FliK [Sulfurimonas sp.]
MLNITTNTKLDIILPSTNKALREVLKNATPKELEALSSGKDLKSVLNSLLKQSSQSSASDKTLLQLLKQNPTLKNLGNVSSSIKDLLSSIKSDEKALPLQKVLKSFLVDIKNLNEKDVKAKLTNSGVFLESRLKNAQNPQLELKNTLTKLQALVDKSSVYEVKSLTKHIQTLLESPILKNATNQALLQPQADNKQLLTLLSRGVEKILQTLESNIKEVDPKLADPKKIDVLFSKEVKSEITKLNALDTPLKLQSAQNVKEIVANDLKSLLLQTKEEVLKSSSPNQAEILKNIDKLALQIDYYQLISHLSNSSSLYLPFSWQELKDGQIELKKDVDDKFYCDISLNLVNFGELNLKLVLYEENQLNIKILSDNQELKELVKENIPSLRSALIGSNITPREIRIQDATKKVPTNVYEASVQSINIGFEIKA